MTSKRLIGTLAVSAIVGFCAWQIVLVLKKTDTGMERVASPTPTHVKKGFPAAGISPGPIGQNTSVDVAKKYDVPGALVVKFVAAFATPITFYGKVVDQHGTPVAGADVILSPNDNPLGGKISEYRKTTDTSGLFSITGLHGLTLAVEIKKVGYYQIPPQGKNQGSRGVFEYGLPSSRAPHRPVESAPVVFVLYKSEASEPLTKVGRKNFRLSRDGSPRTISLTSGEATTGEQITLRAWTKDLGRPVSQRQYDWRLEIDVESGGLTPRTDAFAFEAPEDGYKESDIVDMPASLPPQEWSDSVFRSYFVKFDDGKFGRIDIEMKALGDHFVIWKSYLNPKVGSRNLEAEPTDR
jgi:hypothetical protein